MIRGKAKKDKRTKNLVKRLSPNDIAVIYHEDIDEVAAIHLAEKKVKAVINGLPSISGKYPNQGPKILCDAGIPIIDSIGEAAFNKIKENDTIDISGNNLYANGDLLCCAHILDKNEVERRMQESNDNIRKVLLEFINNTLEYAQREKNIILDPPNLPSIVSQIKDRHVLIVIRGKNYREDLGTLRSYIEGVKPIMIGVDGGGDALMDYGYTPDIVIGDMDSVSDKCLKNCGQIIVHGYPNGECPGMERIQALGLEASSFCFAGTSEDIALVLAYENRAKLIVTVGSHTNMIDFLEKGRKGMASTFLVRMKVGYKIIDAKGVNELYKNNIKLGHIAALFAAALFPIMLVARMTPQIQELYRLLKLRFQLFLGYW